MWYKKAKNAELRGLRFSISFSQMRNELDRKSTTYFIYSNKKINKKIKNKMNLLHIICKTGRMICVLLILLCSCNSSKHTYKKRQKAAPCNCPKFNYVPQDDRTDMYAFFVTNSPNISSLITNH